MAYILDAARDGPGRDPATRKGWALARYRLGIDIGGTFTDFSLLNEETGELRGFKSPTVPVDPAQGVINGLRALLAEAEIQADEIVYLVHGTTIAINTVIQRNGANLGLLVTKGFRDMLEIQRLRLESPVNFTATRPKPLIPRYRVGVVSERILVDGTVDTPLNVEELRDEARRLVRDEGAEGLVVSFLNGYRSPEHEIQAKRVLAELFPRVPVTCSHEVWPQIREYERTIVTILNAYVRPNVVRYLEKLERDLRQLGVRVPPFITKSNGGVTTARNARQATAETLLSGPASGVIGASYLARLAGYTDLITLDMGGTSADIALVRDGQPQYSRDEHVGDFPVVMPAVGVSSIGAGGGSIAWMDQAGVLKVGPRSAGADPGPACYGKGNKEPALSDAFLTCGFLNPDNFVGGRMKLYPELAVEALQPIARALDVDVARAAEAVIEVATANMYAEFSNVLSRHGIDPRDFSLVAFGGAGPIEACFLAEEFHIPRVVVPPSPGTLCALGAMSADVKSDYIKTIHRHLSQVTAQDLAQAAGELEARARRWLDEDAPAVQSSTIAYTADMRYAGQSFEIEVGVEEAWLHGDGLEPLRSAFHDLHQHLYAHSDRTADVEIINLRATISGATPKPTLRQLPRASGAALPSGRRAIHYRRQAYDAAIYQRRDLRAGQSFRGPAIVEQDDTTVLVPHGHRADVDAYGNIVISAGESV